MEWVIANMAPLMFGALVLFMLVGYPVAFALAANGIVFGLIGIDLGLLTPAIFQALPERIFGIMANDTLLAIPFFTFMGAILERCGLAEDMLEGMGKLFGRIPGGLAYAVIIVRHDPEDAVRHRGQEARREVVRGDAHDAEEDSDRAQREGHGEAVEHEDDHAREHEGRERPVFEHLGSPHWSGLW